MSVRKNSCNQLLQLQFVDEDITWLFYEHFVRLGVGNSVIGEGSIGSRLYQFFRDTAGQRHGGTHRSRAHTHSRHAEALEFGGRGHAGIGQNIDRPVDLVDQGRNRF